ncbi:MAG TPA: nucleoside monophosphate kinase [Aggregatilineales bacterium]|nr:nucleoside monophosphate kinase [Aggregatilineales bacterium]
MSLYVIIMGVQGAGKGTQAQFIQREFGIPQISTGDLFRAMRTRTDAFAVQIQTLMNSGALIDDETTQNIVAERLLADDVQKGAIFDGFPRNIAQAQWLDAHLAQKGTGIKQVLLLELDSYTAFKRAYGRVTDPNTGIAYNIYSNAGDIQWQFVEHPEKAFPPRLEATLNGQKLSRRIDDEASYAIKRIDTFLEQTTPLINYYSQKGLVKKIDATLPIETVSQHIKSLLG